MTVDNMSPELLNFFQQSKNPSRYRVEVGIQSFNQQSLQAIGRNQNNEFLKQRLQQLKGLGLVLHGDLIAGLPYESLFSFRQSFNQLYQQKPDEVQVGILKLLKNTRLMLQYQKWQMKFASEAPYQIESSPWISKKDITEVGLVALAVEKLYNSQKLLATLDYLLADAKNEAFAVFAKLGKTIQNLNQPYDLYSLFTAIYQLYNDEKMKGCLNKDYYSQFNQKTKRLFDDRLTVLENKSLKDYLQRNALLTQREYDHYSTVCRGTAVGEDYFVFTVKPLQEKAQLITVAKENL
jgi:radical SAM superfamily enzyme YgiQ (UPF0313 family)